MYVPLLPASQASQASSFGLCNRSRERLQMLTGVVRNLPLCEVCEFA